MKKNILRTTVSICSIGIVVFLLMSPKRLRAQSETPRKEGISFKENSHNFGIIDEEGGSVSFNFIYTNQGSKPLVLTRVTTDCGCTTPRYTRRAVEPGQEGLLSVAYDPLGRPGTFVKNIQVYTNADAKPTILQITGNVVTRGGSGESAYVTHVGDLQISSEFLEFPAMSHQRKQVLKLSLYNPLKKDLEVKLSSSSKLFTLSQSKFTLHAEQPADIILSSAIDSTIFPSIYLEALELEVKTGGSVSPISKILFVKIPVVPPFSKNRETSPHAELTTYYDLGRITESDFTQGSLEIKNIGQSELILYNLYCPHPAISFTIPKEKALTGETIRVNYRIDHTILKKMERNLDENIDLILNDPRGPYRRVKVRLAL